MMQGHIQESLVVSKHLGNRDYCRWAMLGLWGDDPREQVDHLSHTHPLTHITSDTLLWAGPVSFIYGGPVLSRAIFQCSPIHT